MFISKNVKKYIIEIMYDSKEEYEKHKKKMLDEGFNIDKQNIGADYESILVTYSKKIDAVDEGFLQEWYQSSIDETKKPIWTDEHISEISNDFYLIPKDTVKPEIKLPPSYEFNIEDNEMIERSMVMCEAVNNSKGRL